MYEKNILFQKIIKKLLEDLRTSLLNFKFVMIYIIHKMLVLCRNNLNFLNIIFWNAFLRSVIDFEFFKNKYFFSQHIIKESLVLEE